MKGVTKKGGENVERGSPKKVKMTVKSGGNDAKM